MQNGKCELTNEVAMVPGCVYSDYDAMSSTSHLGATACTDCSMRGGGVLTAPC